MYVLDRGRYGARIRRLVLVPFHLGTQVGEINGKGVKRGTYTITKLHIRERNSIYFFYGWDSDFHNVAVFFENEGYIILGI